MGRVTYTKPQSNNKTKLKGLLIKLRKKYTCIKINKDKTSIPINVENKHKINPEIEKQQLNIQRKCIRANSRNSIDIKRL